MNPRPHRPTGVLHVLRNLHKAEVGTLPRLVLGLCSGLLLSAVAMLSAWVYASLQPRIRAGSGYSYIYVRDEYLATAFAVCGLVWFFSLIWIWRGAIRSRPFITPALYTVGVAIAATVAGVVIDGFVRRDQEILIGALVMFAGAVALIIWTSAVLRYRRGKPVLDPENLVDVRCPQCEYSLIGLRSLRCPECGSEFTIDELIRSQDYEGVKSVDRGTDQSRDGKGAITEQLPEPSHRTPTPPLRSGL
jgi:hypothetical protein